MDSPTNHHPTHIMGGQALNRLYEDLGICGWYPLGIFFMLHAVGIGRSFMFIGNAMMSYTPDFRCDLDANDVNNDSGGAGESSVDLLLTRMTMMTTTMTPPVFKNASQHDNSTTASSSVTTCAKNCTGNWTYSVPRSHTFVAEWNVVCDREPLKYLTEMFFYLGCIVACCFMGYASDTFGRRTVILSASIFGGIVGCQVKFDSMTRFH